MGVKKTKPANNATRVRHQQLLTPRFPEKCSSKRYLQCGAAAEKKGHTVQSRATLDKTKKPSKVRFPRHLDTKRFPLQIDRSTTAALDTTTVKTSSQNIDNITHPSPKTNTCPSSVLHQQGVGKPTDPFRVSFTFQTLNLALLPLDIHVTITCLRASLDSGKERSSAARCSTRPLCIEGR